MSDRQFYFLKALASCSAEVSAGRVFTLAYPNAPYRGRRDAGATRTLDAMEKEGWVRGRYGYSGEGGRHWRISTRGREVFAAERLARR